MTTKESIQSAYIDSVLTTGTKPKSVYSFAKQNEMAEQEFYTFYPMVFQDKKHYALNFL